MNEKDCTVSYIITFLGEKCFLKIIWVVFRAFCFVILSNRIIFLITYYGNYARVHVDFRQNKNNLNKASILILTCHLALSVNSFHPQNTRKQETIDFS